MEYLGRTELKNYLDIFLFVDAALTPPEDDWLRQVTSGISEDGVLWYIINNGGGDELMILFPETGLVIKGFDHENDLNQFAADPPDETFFPRLYHGIPEEMLRLFTEEELETATFFMWYLDNTNQWHQNETPDNDGGKGWLLDYIHPTAEDFLEWAQEYYEDTPIDTSVIQELYASGTFTREAALQLNPACDPDSVLAELH